MRQRWIAATRHCSSACSIRTVGSEAISRRRTNRLPTCGGQQLAAIPNAMRGAYRHTTHMMTNHLVEADGDDAIDEVL